MKVFRMRDVKVPTRGTDKSSGVDLYIPNDIAELYNANNCKFTPSELITEEEQKRLKDNHFLFDNDKPYIEIPSGYGILIPSWLKIEMGSYTSDKVYDFILHDKSWVSTKLGLLVWAKVIDFDYAWEMSIHLVNPTKFTIPVYAWQKIVQGIVREVQITNIMDIEDESMIYHNNSQRGEWGFGSTDNK